MFRVEWSVNRKEQGLVFWREVTFQVEGCEKMPLLQEKIKRVRKVFCFNQTGVLAISETHTLLFFPWIFAHANFVVRNFLPSDFVFLSKLIFNIFYTPQSLPFPPVFQLSFLCMSIAVFLYYLCGFNLSFILSICVLILCSILKGKIQYFIMPTA